MGEVYRARDTKLDRDVAIKILPESFATDPDRLMRFEREAKTLATLNHPNIAAIYGVEGPALVMELVEGDDLSALISGSPGLLMNEALPIARQMAAALEAAHERGIIHRDLKPANIKVRPDGTVKVLDFGLAKAMAPSDGGPGLQARATSAGSEDPALRTQGSGPGTQDPGPTVTSPALTAMGMVLGTAAYMAPEQARGKAVDRRADIWAFGVVLYEMLTGLRLFDGETVSDVLAAVLTREPDLSRLPAEVPPTVLTLLGRCLERDPSQRLRDIGEARVTLERALTRPADTSTIMTSAAAGEAAPAAAPSPRTGLPWAVAALATVAAIIFGVMATRRPAAPVESLMFELSAPAGTHYSIGSNIGTGIISPNGSMVAFLARDKAGVSLWVRSLLTGDARQLAGTTNGFYPFWSPDSRALAFFTGGQMLRVDVAGGLPSAIAKESWGRGGSWSTDDVILFTPIGGGTVHRVAATGGPVEQVTTLDVARGENAHYWPVWLPGNQAFLYFVRSSRAENNGIYMGYVDGRPAVRLVTSLSSGAYAPPSGSHPGALLWVRENQLLAQPLDIDAGRLTGEVAIVADDVRVEDSQRSLFASVSDTGTLVWAAASAVGVQVAAYARGGQRIESLPISADKISQVRVSPDGRKLAFTKVIAGTADVWVYDFESAATIQLTTGQGYNESPVWARDSQSLAYGGSGGMSTLKRLDGSRPPVVLAAAKIEMTAVAFTPDDRFLLATESKPTTSDDLAFIDVTKPDVLRPLSSEPGGETGPAVSPDGKWLAFSWEPSVRPEVVLAPLINDGQSLRLGRPWLPVSQNGGSGAVWRRDGREIIYATPNGTLVAVAVTPSGNALLLGPPAALFALPANVGSWDNSWSVMPDHSRFIVLEEPAAAGQTLHVLTHWRDRAPR